LYVNEREQDYQSMKRSDEIIPLLCHIAGLLQAQQDQVLQELLGIGFAQYKILAAVQAFMAASQLNVAQSLAQTEASISRQVKLLGKMNLIDIQIQKNNRRQHILILTDEGKRVLEAAHQAVAKFDEKSLNFNEKQAEQLHELLSELHRFSCNIGDNSTINHTFA
jgi:DNA-binding MarR family transcriptional regulator